MCQEFTATRTQFNYIHDVCRQRVSRVRYKDTLMLAIVRRAQKHVIISAAAAAVASHGAGHAPKQTHAAAQTQRSLGLFLLCF